MVVTVEARSGAKRRRTASDTAASRAIPAAMRLPTSSVITMAASTSSPSATMRPVTDIWWIGTPSALSVATEASETTGRTAATMIAGRQPSVRNRTPTTSAIPSAMFEPTSASRSAV